MRKTNWLGTIAALAATGIALMAARPARARDAAPEPRRADAHSATTFAFDHEPAAMAVTNWLWSDPVTGQCRVPARWAEAPVGATLGGLLKVSLRDATRVPAVAARAAAWVSREQIETAGAHDADLASKIVSFNRDAAAVVRILRAGDFKSRRARLGAEPLAA